MKIVKRLAAIMLSVCLVIPLVSCSRERKTYEITLDGSSTADEPKDNSAVELSANVNERRFTLTLSEFTERYNNQKRIIGDTDLIIEGNWRENGGSTKDNNGIEIQYYYYDDYNVNLTATVETETKKLVNIGLGTTLSNYMTQTDGENNSDSILEKAALMAKAACQLDDVSDEVLKDIFNSIATGSNDSVWYRGFVFDLSTKEDAKDRKNNIMLFRVFPISAELKEKWKIDEYK